MKAADGSLRYPPPAACQAPRTRWAIPKSSIDSASYRGAARYHAGDDMPNLYRDTAGPAAPTPPLEGDVRADVAVVGGGFTGLSAALHLAERGARVVVLEAQEPGWGASGRNGGQINAGLKHDPDEVERDFGAELGGRMNALCGAAPDVVFSLIERHNIACEARRNGTLRAAVHANHAAKLQKSVEQWRRRGAPVELIDGAALARQTGTERYLAAAWDRRGGDLNPLGFARGLARAAMRAGATIHGGTQVSSLATERAAWKLVTATGTVLAEHVVLATNGYTDDLWPQLRRTVVPLFGAIAATAQLPDHVAKAVMPGRAVLYESGAVTVYYRVDGSGRLLIGGRGPMHEIDSCAKIPHLVAYARALWPALRDIEWTHAWGGRLAMTPDQYPHVHEPAPGVIACLGYNGRGVAMATTMGAELAKRILDPSGPLAMPVTAMKKIPLHGLWPVAVRAAIARGRLSDFLGF
jgi:glycine/D-amino acid oxidase-like deaminating enzyme